MDIISKNSLFSDKLFLLSLGTFIYLVFLVNSPFFLQEPNVNVNRQSSGSNYYWVSHFDGEDQFVYLVGPKLDDFLGTDIYFDKVNKDIVSDSFVELGDFSSQSLKIVWDNSDNNYSFFVQPGVDKKIKVNMPLLTIDSGNNLRISEKSIVYISKYGPVYPKIYEK